MPLSMGVEAVKLVIYTFQTTKNNNNNIWRKTNHIGGIALEEEISEKQSVYVTRFHVEKGRGLRVC